MLPLSHFDLAYQQNPKVRDRSQNDGKCEDRQVKIFLVEELVIM
jgi:hypothetical protein